MTGPTSIINPSPIAKRCEATGGWKLVLGMCLLCCGGCHWLFKPAPLPPSSAPAPTEQWTSAPVTVPPAPARPVATGSLPLVYIVVGESMVRIVDDATGQDLLKVPVPARTLIAIDASAGIKIGSTTMKLGPLPEDHRYSIYLESTTQNVTQQGVIRPGQR